jgi:serine/threonine-protein kinase
VGDLLARLQAGIADRYRVVRELGQGGMAVVFLAEDLKHHRRAALKVLRPELSTAVGHDRFLREIGIAAGLAHPHILPLYDSGETAGLVYYVMPYVEGESLGDRLRREGRLPVNEALRIAAEVADALAYAHGAGLVHRDVKPENILFQGGHAVVADFGVARAMDTAGAGQITEVGLALGTPVYMSPEQAAADAIDGRSDVYALGCVLYEMLAGEPPYTGETARAILARHALAAIPSVRAARPEVSAGVDAAIVRALGRPGTAGPVRRSSVPCCARSRRGRSPPRRGCRAAAGSCVAPSPSRGSWCWPASSRCCAPTRRGSPPSALC